MNAQKIDYYLTLFLDFSTYFFRFTLPPIFTMRVLIFYDQSVWKLFGVPKNEVN